MWKKFLKIMLCIMGALLALIVIFWCCISYTANYKKTTCDTSVSPDGEYELTLQAVGEPEWPFGSARGKLILKNNENTILLQNIELGNAMEDMHAGMVLRDRFMAENTMWILGQEEARGNSRIFISGHNGHVEQFGSYDEENPYMGHILADTIGETSYFVIGTDFYKTTNNMPKGSEGRTKFTAYSHNQLAKAAKKCGYDICWLDFSKIPGESALKPEVTGYCYMGNMGENQMTLLNRIVMRVFPYTYRIWGSPASMYDGMIFVTEAHPTQIR